MPYLHIVDYNGAPIKAQSAYEGASTGRRMSSWMASSSGVNSLILNSINTLRARARDLRRNNPLADGAVDSFVADLIGTGISPSWQIDNPELKKAIQELWNDWIKEADFDETWDFYGLEALVSQALVESGEALVWMKVQPEDSDLIVPLQLQVMEGDHLDENYFDTLKNGNEVRFGIEFDRRGKKVAYHLWPEHPGEYYGTINMTERIRVPADEICHIFRPTRPGQRRGTTWLASIIVKMYDYDGFDDAELMRKKGAAMIGGYITMPVTGTAAQMPNSPFGPPTDEDAQGRDIVPLEPGMFPKLPPGADVKYSMPADVGGNYEIFMKQQQRAMARGAGTTYEKFTGDLTEVNFSSIRAGLLDFQRGCRQKQLQVLAFQMGRPVTQKWMSTAILSGALDISDYAQNKRRYWRIKWRPEAWKGVDEIKDALARQLRVRNGFTSLQQEREEMGGDSEQIDLEIEESNKINDEKGFIFDSDSRKTAKSGTAQALESAALMDTGKE